MLRLWRDRLEIVLTPQQLRLQRLAPAWRGGRPLAGETMACGGGIAEGEDEPAWGPALAALRDALQDRRWAATAGTVILSNHFVRYLTLPWDEQLVTAEEQQAMVRHAFGQAYGAAADSWVFRWDAPPPPAPCLASAVDAPLLHGLRELFAAAALPLASVQPQLMAAFNASRRQMRDGTNCWFLVEEAGRLCLAWFHDNAVGSLYSQRVGPDWVAELPGVLERAMLLASADSAPGPVYLHLATAREVAAELPAGWSLHLLPQSGPAAAN